MIGGVVIAAGRSTRMGRSKALLDAGGESFLGRCIEALRQGGCEAVVAVVDLADAAAVAEAEGRGAAVVGSDGGTEQVESIRRGLEALPGGTVAGVVLPVDHPLVRPETVAALVGCWRGSAERIVRPVHEGAPGHPTVFPRPVWPSLVRGLERGARTVVEDGSRPRTDLMVADPGVIADIDTPEAYERWLGS